MKAFYSATVSDFLAADTKAIIGRLSSEYSDARYYSMITALIESWRKEVAVLRTALIDVGTRLDTESWHILLEYPIPRRGKRIDAVILGHGVIAVIEFKIGAKVFQSPDRMQVEDYCLDLRDFHAESTGYTVVPILVATEARPASQKLCEINDSVKSVRQCNASDLSATLLSVNSQYSLNDKSICADAWENSEYRPTPTILEAAQTLYAGQNVKEISRSHAGAENLTKTSEAVFRAIEQAKHNQEKLICFITGVPGSGKTLAGLNIVHNKKLHEKELGVFLSGNGPLVKILREALARDKAATAEQRIGEARRSVSTFIQNVHNFLDDYYKDKDRVPPDKMVVFDEAQRAWDRDQAYRKFRRDCSEPEMFLEIMDRHEDWAVIVGLIGGGQEINRGEAGLSEWGKRIAGGYAHWKIMISPELEQGDHSTGGQVLFPRTPSNVTIVRDEDLHLKVSIRSFRAEKTSEFVGNLLDLNQGQAKSILQDHLGGYEIVMTRSLERAKAWLKDRQRGTRRIGLTASSGARRLRAHGLDVRHPLDEVQWFLNGANDVRSSYYLEEVATEFAVQGLELDWTCICWGGDLRFKAGRWAYKAFKGTKWQNVRNARTREYILNKYRVLLTRAREGLVIWVPLGDEADPTRTPAIYDPTAEYLITCGIPEL